MTTIFVDTVNGSDVNPGTEASPRRTLPAQADHLWVRVRRGSNFNRTTQYGITAQGMIFSDYGPPEAPKPSFTINQPSASTSFIHYGDTIWANFDFKYVDRSTPPPDAIGQNTLTFGRRGNAASPTPCVSGAIISCSFTDNGGSAICPSVLTGDSQWAEASPVLLVLGCDFEQIVTDAVFGSVLNYFEVGHCTYAKTKFRNDANANPDFINMIYANPQYVWVHDNYVDHHEIDLKHLIVFDLAAGQTGGLALIENNILLSRGARKPYTQAAVNAGINTEMRCLVRNNYLRGSRLLLVSQATAPGGVEAYGNLFDYTGSGDSNAAVLLNSPNAYLHHNTFFNRARKPGASAVFYTSTATGQRNDKNLYIGFETAINSSSARAFITGGDNRFVDCENRWWDGTDGPGDEVLSANELVDQFGTPLKPKPGKLQLSMRALDRRVPDFWGRFPAEGVGYIGALLERS